MSIVVSVCSSRLPLRIRINLALQNSLAESTVSLEDREDDYANLLQRGAV